jgi:tetratricopeptide (TPR) repeat protein
MLHVLRHALALARRPFVALALALLGLGGSALVLLPGLGTPGFELSLVLSVAVGLLGGGVGVGAALLERRLIQGLGNRPAGVPRLDSAFLSVLRAVLSSLLLLVLALALPFLVSVGHALLRTACNPFALVGFFPLLTLPSALLASAAGVLSGLSARRAGGALAFYALLVAVSLGVTLWPLWAGPQVFAFNHFLGHLPGPLYDEALEVTAALGWFRLETLLLALACWLLTSACLDMRTGTAQLPRFRPGSLALFAACVAGVVSIEGRAHALGLRSSDAHVAGELGGRRETEHFTLVFPRGKPREDVERLVRDLEFRHAQVKAVLGEVPREKVTVWLYRSDEEKRKLVGAGRTQFAKPWRLEVHVSDRPFPHASLKHELVHALAAPAGRGPFRVTARLLGLYPVMGVVEGLAVAVDAPVQGELTLHEWAAGMRREGLAPDVRALLGPRGFYASAPARAYTVAGSFLRFLADRHGPAPLRALYHSADFQGAYGRPLEELASAWEAHLDALPLDPSAAERAFARFREKGLFARACGREVARLEEQAREASGGDPGEALRLYQRAATLQPEEPRYQLGVARALEQLDRAPEARAALEALAARVAPEPVLAAEVALAQADLAVELKAGEEARAHLERVVGFKPGPELVRGALVRRAALDSPALAAPVRSYFRDLREDLRLWRLGRALAAQPGEPYLNYLLGRRLVQSGAPVEAAGHLTRALLGEPLPEPLHREALRLRLQASYLAGDCAAVRTDAGALPGLGEGFATEAREWVARCDFEQQAFAGALVPSESLR